MRLNRLEARNYRLHSHLIVDFDALGSFTVTGPNGVGKSSFIEAIRYALKGKHRSSSGAGASRIVKLGTTTCVVTLDFSVLGGRYRVVRKRLTTGRGKGELELYQILDDGALIALTEGNADATQARLDLLVGVDDDTLMATSYVAQGDAARFSGATPSGRKAVLRSVLRIEEFRPAAREARERQRAHAVSADAHESNALGLETAEGELAEVQARLRELEEAMTTAATDATAARVTLSTAERALAGVEARARQAAEAAATRARQVAQVNRLGQDVERLTAEVARLTAAASAEVSANGGRAAALIPELEHQRAQLNGALAGAAIRQGEQRGLKSTVEGIRARLDALRVELETPLPDLGEPLEVLEARVSELPALRARVDATMRAASEHEVLTRRLEELAVNGRALSERIAEHRVEPALLSSEETAASGLQAARERLSALAVQVADRTALEGQLARLRASIAAFRSDLAALPPPPADLETVRARAAGLTEASENRRAIAARAAAAADQLKVATERLSAAREAASLATHKAEAAARELLGNARAACQDSSPWRAPDGREVELFTACPLSARLATLERDQPALRSAAEAAEADAQAARREVAGLGISQADAAEALAKADAEVDAATAATARLREIERQSAARLELEAELSRVEGRIPDAEAALSALAGVAAAHASALADVDHAQRATDRLAVLRTRVERVTAWEAERETARAEWQRVHNAHAAAGDVEQAWRAAMRERTTADAAADLLARHRTALARRERAQAGVKSVQEELSTAEARLNELGDPGADVAKVEAQIQEVDRALADRRREVEAGRAADLAEAQRERAQGDLDRAQAADQEARQALAAMPDGASLTQELETAQTEVFIARGESIRLDGEVERLRGELREVERRASVSEAGVTAKRRARAAAEVEHRAATAWARTAEVCELAPTLLMEQTIPVLEAETNAVLERISSRGLRVRLETQRELAREDGTTETLDIVVENDVGTLTYEDCSGGEQTRIDMALRIGLSRLLSGGRAVDFLIMDEGWGALDDEGVDALREVVAGLQLLYSTVILITHKGTIFDCLGRRLHVSAGPDGSVVTVM